MTNWHSMKALLGQKIICTFGVTATLIYDSDDTEVPLSVKFDEHSIEIDTEDGEVVTVLAARCLIHREDLPLDGDKHRAITPTKDRITVDEIPLPDGRSLSAQTFTVYDVDKDKGSLYKLHLRRK